MQRGPGQFSRRFRWCRSQLIASCCFQLLIYFLSAEFDSGINHCRQDFLRKIQGISIPVGSFGKVIDVSLLFSVCNHWHLSVHRMDFNFLDLSPSNPVGHYKFWFSQEFVVISLCWNCIFSPQVLTWFPSRSRHHNHMLHATFLQQILSSGYFFVFSASFYLYFRNCIVIV